MNSLEPPNSVPASLLARLIRETWEPIEIKVVLTSAMLGAEADPVGEREILEQEVLNAGLRLDGSQRDARERIVDALELASARGTLIRLVNDAGERWYLLGTDANHQRGRLGISVDVDRPVERVVALRPERPTVFAVFEQNVGLVTPIVADRLVDAMERYPEAWIVDAIGEAVTYNKRNWRYIQRVLENWASEGRSDETHRRTASRDLNREKHLRGKYAAVFRREPD